MSFFTRFVNYLFHGLVSTDNTCVFNKNHIDESITEKQQIESTIESPIESTIESPIESLMFEPYKLTISTPMTIAALPNKFYWARYHDDGNSGLYQDYMIKEYLKDRNIIQSNQELYDVVKHSVPNGGDNDEGNNNGGCGNPWNYMTYHEDRLIRSMKIPNGKPPVVVESNKFVKYRNFNEYNKKQIYEYLLNLISSDCWVVYTRTRYHHAPVTVYFDSRDYANKTGLNPSGFSQEHRAKRDKLLDAPILNNLLSEAYTNNHEICVYMGCKSFIDQYFCPNMTRESFDVAVIEYPIS